MVITPILLDPNPSPTHGAGHPLQTSELPLFCFLSLTLSFRILVPPSLSLPPATGLWHTLLALSDGNVLLSPAYLAFFCFAANRSAFP